MKINNDAQSESEKSRIHNNAAGFVVPFWSDGKPHRMRYLERTLGSIHAQTDQNWRCYIVDDHSESQRDKQRLLQLERESSGKVTVIFAHENAGPGVARNLGAKRAYDEECSFVCWLDADDKAHPRRVEETRNILKNRSEVDVVYSHFSVIDEDDVEVPLDRCISTIKSIVHEINSDALEGYDTWIRQATERNTITIPSALSLRTRIAIDVPYPHKRLGEDVPTWLNYSAFGCYFLYAKDIPSQYRVPQKSGAGSEARDRAGGLEAYNRNRVALDTWGVNRAIEAGLAKGTVSIEAAKNIKVSLLKKLARYMYEEGDTRLGDELTRMVAQINVGNFLRFPEPIERV